ncbi:MAG: hypothetical protein AAFQ82_01990 [Myxococcota bacterium]
MPTIATPCYSIHISERFEKVLCTQRLLRAERMDRDEGERSFAELNVYIGPTEDAGPQVAAKTNPDDACTAWWTTHLQREGDEARVATRHTSEGCLLARVELSATDWRPRSEQSIFFRAFDCDAGLCFHSFVLEYDADWAELYRGLASEMIESIDCSYEKLTNTTLDAQSQFSWSIFDEMSESRREAIVKRYAQILGRHTPVPTRETQPALRINLKELNVDRTAEELVGRTDYAAELLSPHFAEPLTLEPDEYETPSLETLRTLLLTLAHWGPTQTDEAAHHAWAHCSLCFDVTDYGAPEGVSNEAYFEIRNPEDAFLALGKGSIQLPDEDEDPSVFGLVFYPPWEDEHGCTLVFKQGSCVGWVSAGDPLRVP